MSEKKETAVQVRQQVSPLIMLGSRFNIEPAKLTEVLRGTVIKPHKGVPATDAEVAAFCIVANQYDLNPFTKEIYAFASAEKGVTAIVPIDGWVKIVNRHKDADGNLDFDGCTFEEVPDASGNPDYITCTMHIKGRSHPIVATERYNECKRGTGPWGQHPWRMLRHKAYMQAARYAFGLSGIHDEDEARDITASVEVREPIRMPTPKKQIPATATEETVAPAAEPTIHAPDTTAPQEDDRTVLAEVKALVIASKAAKIKKVADATGWKWDDDEPLDALSLDTLKAIRSLLKC